MELPKATVDKITRKAGAHRVSEGAPLVAHLEETAVEIARGAGKMVNFTGRRSVEAEYIESVRKGKSKLAEYIFSRKQKS
jgi:histone H3/H4